MNREENLRNTLIMMNNRFNSAHWDNPHNDRYAVELDIISVEMNIAQDSASFPVIEILQTHIVDKRAGSVMPVSSAITLLLCAGLRF